VDNADFSAWDEFDMFLLSFSLKFQSSRGQQSGNVAAASPYSG
jgi:hypothetical protein